MSDTPSSSFPRRPKEVQVSRLQVRQSNEPRSPILTQLGVEFCRRAWERTGLEIRARVSGETAQLGSHFFCGRFQAAPGSVISRWSHGIWMNPGCHFSRWGPSRVSSTTVCQLGKKDGRCPIRTCVSGVSCRLHFSEVGETELADSGRGSWCYRRFQVSRVPFKDREMELGDGTL